MSAMRTFQLLNADSERPSWTETGFVNSPNGTTGFSSWSGLWCSLEENGIATCRSLHVVIARHFLQTGGADRIVPFLEELRGPIDELIASEDGSAVTVLSDEALSPIPPLRLRQPKKGPGAIADLAEWMIRTEAALSQLAASEEPRRFFFLAALPHELPDGQCAIALTATLDCGGPPQLSDGAAIAAGDKERRRYFALDDLLRRDPRKRAALSDALTRISAVIGASFSAEFLWTGSELILFELCATNLSKRLNARAVRRQLLQGKIPTRPALGGARIRDILEPEVSTHDDAFHDCVELGRFPSSGTRIATGRVAISREQIDELSGQNQPVVLLCERLDPGEASILPKLAGLVLRTAGPASHITVMAHAAGVAVLSGSQQLQFDASRDAILFGREELQTGTWVTVDEVEGRLLKGAAQLARNTDDQCRAFVEIGTSSSCCRVLTNANDCAQAITGIALGAQGIGLCRSEAHVFHSQHTKALWECVAGWLNTGRTLQVPTALAFEMGAALRDLLTTAAGRVVNYRLIDASIHELQDSARAADTVGDLRTAVQDAGFGVRGPRWALPSGFYEWQVSLAVSAAMALADFGQKVDLILTVPSVTTVAELAAVKRLFHRATLSVPLHEHCKIRLGVMIETTRAVIFAGELARLADVLCFGLNDLTQSVWSLGRESWQLLHGKYRSLGLVANNPFASLDSSALLGLLEQAIASARRVKPDIDIIMCGEQTADEFTARTLAAFAPIALSCHADALPAAALASIRVDGMEKHVPLPNNVLEGCTGEALERIRYARLDGRTDVGHAIALDWARLISDRFAIPPSENWKVFKRDLVQRQFGRLNIRRFSPPWSVVDAATYAHSIKETGAAARFSVFPSGISCHSRSEAIRSDATFDEVRSTFSALDRTAIVEVFPQQSPNQLCFRVVRSGGLTTIEAGLGQAMYVFENERGKHPVGFARYEPETTTWALHVPEHADQRLSEELKILTDRHGPWILASFYCTAHTMGIEAFAVEGYFDLQSTGLPVIVDIDLPTDFAWN